MDQVAGFEAQLRELAQAGCERVFKEQVSSVAASAELERALEFVREGNCLTVCKLDRLARSTAHLLKIAEALEANGVGPSHSQSRPRHHHSDGEAALHRSGGR